MPGTELRETRSFATETTYLSDPIKIGQVQAMTQRSYNRMARLGTSDNGPVRFTLDTNLRALPMFDKAFIPGVGVPLLSDSVILEIKYRVEIPSVFRQLIEQFGLSRAKVSKYR